MTASKDLANPVNVELGGVHISPEVLAVGDVVAPTGELGWELFQT